LRRIHVCGPSGAGTSTLGRLVNRERGLTFLDSDDFYWLPSETPFSKKRPPEARSELLGKAASLDGEWIISGSMMGWGDFLIPALTGVIYLWKPAEIRLKRLALRENERFGSRIGPEGDLRAQYESFMAWANAYDSGGQGMRSRLSEEAWMARLSCPILRIEDDIDEDGTLALALPFIDSAG
jgi:adenylate kinase family enzyme